MYVTLCGGLRKNPTPFHNATLLCMGFPTGYSESMPFEHLLHRHYTDKTWVFYVTPLGTGALSVIGMNSEHPKGTTKHPILTVLLVMY